MNDPASRLLKKPLTAGPAGYLSACACLALSMALVGAYVALSRPLVAAFPVFLLAWLRFAIGALAMPHWLKKPAGEPPLAWATHGWLFLIALFGNFLFSIFMLHGMQLSSAITAGIVMAAIPAAVALLSRLFLREHLSLRMGLAIALAVGGVAMAQMAPSRTVGPAGAATGASAFLGPLLLLAAVLCEATYAVIGKRLTRQLGARRISALINLWGLALMTPLGLAQALDFDFNGISAGLWGLLVFYALAASVWSVWLWMTGLRRVPAAQSGVFTVFLPIAAALTGVMVLGEDLHGAQMAAFAIALLGVILATRPPSPPAAPTDGSGVMAPARGKND